MENNILSLAKNASNPAAVVSPKYAFVETQRIHEMLGDYGFREDKYTQRRERSPERAGYQRHISILQREQDCDMNGAFNLMLLNSHDGSSAIQLEAGYFRILCENQLGHGDIGIKVRHVGDVVGKLERAIPQVILQMEEFKRLVAELRGRPLTTEQIDVLVNKGLELRGLPNILENNVRMQSMRRREERDAWSIFNAVQENVVRGGVRFYTERKDEPGAYDYRLLRPITAAERLLEANRELTATVRELCRAA